ncbi:peptidoglycan DD-metalloendopeptidase family protein [Echinicola soli]|uniref:Peptidoglycan DD-metalloendopeptidase family protein n=1 Tax=Echinicola soli TaxID=2591634 RepID=A0A514CL11_9BACT|nr:M23 family metallopeptidase [Echinicola soli]QDH80509.1 peptidoglycan DD-metalloendopeptidase family protein [Echinicola soli]
MGIRIIILLVTLNLCVGFSEAYAQIFPKIIKKDKTPAVKVPDARKLQTFDVEEYLYNLQKGTDSLIYQDRVDLRRRLSAVSEDTLTLIWAPTHQLAQVSEKIQIDSIWVTAYEYYSSWDSQRIDSYGFDPKGFKDTVMIKLYDPFHGTNWSSPLKETKINSEFGFRRYRWHHGTDLDLNRGDPVYSVFDGIVRMRSYDRYGYGYYLVVRHKNGLETLYGHLSKYNVEVGQEVKAGEVIAYGGSTGRSTGPHLHFEVRYQGLSINPTELFDFSVGRLKNSVYTVTSTSFEHIIKMRQAVYHRVRSGENLSVIANRYGTSVRTITRLNNISSRSILRVGQRLRIR